MKILKILFFLTAFTIKSQYYVGIDKNTPTVSLTFDFGNSNNLPIISDDGSLLYKNSNNVSKYLPNGLKDNLFGTNGYGSIFLQLLKSIHLQNQFIYTNSAYKLSKFDYNGKPDLTFGTNGYYDFNRSGDILYVEESSGRILIKDYPNLYRYLYQQSSGLMDLTFPPIPANRVFLTADKNLLVENASIIKKYDWNGQQDTSFGNQGELVIPQSSNITVNKNTGEIYISNTYIPVTVTKYFADGKIDSSYNNNPISVEFIKSMQVSGITLDNNNKLLIHGGTPKTSYLVYYILRLESNGLPDNNFNNNTFYTINSGLGYLPLLQVLNDNNKYRVYSSYTGGSGTPYLKSEQILRTMNKDEVILSVNKINNYSKISVFPNPVKDFFNVQLNPNESLKQINLFDVNGKLVLSSKTLSNDISHLTSNNYVIEIITDKSSYKAKIIKN